MKIKLSELRRIAEAVEEKIEVPNGENGWERITNPVNEIEFQFTFSPGTVIKLIEIAKASRELLDYLDNEIGMDKPQLTWLRSALKGVEL